MHSSLAFIIGMIAFLGMFTVLVVVHEGGHFLVSKLFGVAVLKFRVGFGRPVVTHIGSSGTQYGIGWLPLGGFVEPWSRHGAFARGAAQPVRGKAMEDIPGWQQLLILAAGPLMNGVLAAVLFAGLAFHGQVIVPPIVGSVTPGSWAARAGVRPGDRFVAIGGDRVTGWPQVFSDVISRIGDGRYPVTVRTPGGRTRHLVFDGNDFHLGHNQTYIFSGKGLTPLPLRKVPRQELVVSRPRFAKAVAQGIRQTISTTTLIFDVVGKMVSGKISSQALSGPIAMAQVSTRVFEMGWLHFVLFGAFFSVNLMVMNILPIPGLDGGGILMTLVGMARRRPLDPNALRRVTYAGYVILIILAVFVCAQDLYFLR